MDYELKAELIAFIKKNNTDSTLNLETYTDNEIINFEIQKESHDHRMEFSYTGPLLSVLIHDGGTRGSHLASIIIDLGATTTTQDSAKCTPLFYALEKENMELALTIAGHGGDTNKVPATNESEFESDSYYVKDVPDGVSIKEVLLGNQGWPGLGEGYCVSLLDASY